MKIKKGDTVKIMAGKDRGKSGKVVQAFPELARVSVEGCNITFKHLRGKGRGQGQRIEYPAPIHVSNVMLICPHTGKPTRIQTKVTESGVKQRLSQKSGKAI